MTVDYRVHIANNRASLDPSQVACSTESDEYTVPWQLLRQLRTFQDQDMELPW
jgi:hypothetical protein